MLVGVDWGTTRLRACLIGDDGDIRARVETDDGMRSVAPGAFARTLDSVLYNLPGATRAPLVVLSGMVGSRDGWCEVPYVEMPATLAALARGAAVVDLPGRGEVVIVPGVAHTTDDGSTDVARGEETQVVGAMRAMGIGDGTFVLPGTHSKWITVRGGALVALRTFMTGDVFAALRHNTILSHSVGTDGTAGDSFIEGLSDSAALNRPGDLLNALFTVRTADLFGRRTGAAATDYLSGLLIGAEVLAAVERVGHVIIVGMARLATLYERALRHVGVPALRAPESCAALGHLMIAQARATVRAQP